MRLACLFLAAVAALGSVSARADSASSASLSASSKSVGSVSDSIQGSSNSSTGKQVAAGEYQLVQVAQAEDRPGMVRLTLSGEPGEFQLTVPAQVVATARLQAGDAIAVTERPYGYEFARSQPREPFFLALQDGWMHELQSRPVGG